MGFTIQYAIRKPWQIKDKILHVTTSMGIAIADLRDINRCSIMKKADLAMYEAIRSGKNKYMFFVE